MRAVNLIPSDSLRGGGGAGNGPVALLGALGLLLVLVTVYVMTNNTVADRQAERDALTVQAAQAQAQAEQVRPYREFAALARARVDTVRQLGSARFDWHAAFSDLARAIPDNVWLTAATGTVTAGVTVEGGGSSAASSLRSSIPNPAIELTGCTVGHEAVVRLVSRLRVMRGVQRVSLADSTKDGGGDCQNGNTSFPQFDLVVFFNPIPVVSAPVTPATSTPTPIAATGGSATTPQQPNGGGGG
jgi:Tfp pilus assembly protein PilN